MKPAGTRWISGPPPLSVRGATDMDPGLRRDDIVGGEGGGQEPVSRLPPPCGEGSRVGVPRVRCWAKSPTLTLPTRERERDRGSPPAEPYAACATRHLAARGNLRMDPGLRRDNTAGGEGAAPYPPKRKARRSGPFWFFGASRPGRPVRARRFRASGGRRPGVRLRSFPAAGAFRRRAAWRSGSVCGRCSPRAD